MIQLPKIVRGGKKRIGRGYGSGRGGHTVGRGQKGQKARGKIGVIFEGVKMKKSLIKRLPLKRGKGKLKPRGKPLVVNLEVLNFLTSGSEVNIDSLIEGGIVDRQDAREFGVKILGKGDLKKKLIIALPISNSAARKVQKAGGEVLVNPKS